MIEEYTYAKKNPTFYSKTSLVAAYYFNGKTGLFYESGYSNADGLSNKLGISFRL